MLADPASVVCLCECVTPCFTAVGDQYVETLCELWSSPLTTRTILHRPRDAPAEDIISDLRNLLQDEQAIQPDLHVAEDTVRHIIPRPVRPSFHKLVYLKLGNVLVSVQALACAGYPFSKKVLRRICPIESDYGPLWSVWACFVVALLRRSNADMFVCFVQDEVVVYLNGASESFQSVATASRPSG